MTATYRDDGAEQLAIAQQVIDRHATSSADGLCIRCRVPGPCARHLSAVVVFRRFGRLPRRRPGLTRPDLIGAASARFAWLGQTG